MFATVSQHDAATTEGSVGPPNAPWLRNTAGDPISYGDDDDEEGVEEGVEEVAEVEVVEVVDTQNKERSLSLETCSSGCLSSR